MAISAGTLQGRVMKFQTTSDAVKPGALSVVSLQGSEGISRPYQFDLDFVSREAEIDVESLLQHSAAVVVKQAFHIPGETGIKFRSIRYQGTLSSFDFCEGAFASKGNPDWFLYRATLVPHLWRLSLNLGCRVFLDKNIPQIVEEVLWDNKFLPDQYEFRMNRDVYRKREFVLQYQESDLNFFSRLLEQEGIYYWFEHEGTEEKIVFGDSPAAYGAVQGGDAVPYRQVMVEDKNGAYGRGIAWVEPEVVFSLRSQVRLLPLGVTLQDYCSQSPTAKLRSKGTAAKAGFGQGYEYGDHYLTEKEGTRLAEARGQEIQTRQRVFQGAGVVKSFHAGMVFGLEKHHREAFNQSYLITEVRHSVEQSMALGSPQAPTASYENEFVCVPATLNYRPPRLTPKPRIGGFLHATVDAAGDGQYAELDDQGRYKVKLKLDLSDLEKGTASCWIPMAQPYAGNGYGVHFPLHKGIEVAVAFANGDPDRPLILGAVPNPTTRSPVVGSNQTQCIVKSAGNNMILFEDQEGQENLFLHAQKNESVRVNGSVRERVGGNRHLMVRKNRYEEVGRDSHVTVKGHRYERIGGGLHLKIEGDQSVSVQGNQSVQVTGGSAQSVTGNLQQKVQGTASYVFGTTVTVEATAGLTLQCGGSSIVLTPAAIGLNGLVLGRPPIPTGAIPPIPGAPVALRSPSPPQPPKEPGTIEPAEGVPPGTLTEGEPFEGSEDSERKTSWIEIELVDEEGDPVAGESYRIELPDGGAVEGSLDKKGRARVDGIDPGTCTVTFPRLDGEAWE